MSDLIISDPLARRLRILAEREHRSVDEVLETMIDHYPAKDKERSGLSALQIMAAMEKQADNPVLTMLGMAQEANLTFTENDVVERSREILNTEYADYLLKRMREDDASR